MASQHRPCCQEVVTMPVKQLTEFLDEAGVEYMCLSHPPAFTAQQLAHHVKIAGDRVVKTVIIELDGKMAMLVMPATWRVRWDRLSRIDRKSTRLNSSHVRISYAVFCLKKKTEQPPPSLAP